MKYSDKELLDFLHQEIFSVCEAIETLREIMLFTSIRTNQRVCSDMNMYLTIVKKSLGDLIANKLHQVSDKAVVSKKEQVSLEAYISRQSEPKQTQLRKQLNSINKKYAVVKRKIKVQRMNLAAHGTTEKLNPINHTFKESLEFANSLRLYVENISENDYGVGYINQPAWGSGKQTRLLFKKIKLGDIEQRKNILMNIKRSSKNS